MVAPWDVYAERFFPLGYGHPLWIPEPSPQFGEVRIGDIGYISEGRFHFLFNCRCQANAPVNVRGAPDFFELFVPPPSSLVNNDREITQFELRSEGLQWIIAEGQGNISAPVFPQVGMEASLRYKCREQSGALLRLNQGKGTSERLTCDLRIKEYMRRNLPSWHAFATDTLGIDLREADILFVSGLVKTTSWAEAAFSCESSNAELYISGGLPLPLGGAVSSSFSATLAKCEQPTVFHRWGPSGRAVASPVASDAQQQSDQCIFVSYFKMKSRLFRPRVMRAAAGYSELPPGPHGGGEQSPEHESYSLPSNEDDLNVGLNADPVGQVLDHILEYSKDVDVAIASDRDATLCYSALLRNEHRGGFRAGLRTLLPIILVTSGVGSLLTQGNELAEDSDALTGPPKQTVSEAVTVPSAWPAATAYPNTSFGQASNASIASFSNPRSGDGASSQHWRMALNQYCEKTRQVATWRDMSSGPVNARTWTAVVLLDGQESGQGHGLNAGSAREIAAEQALRTIWSMGSK